MDYHTGAIDNRAKKVIEDLSCVFRRILMVVVCNGASSCFYPQLVG